MPAGDSSAVRSLNVLLVGVGVGMPLWLDCRDDDWLPCPDDPPGGRGAERGAWNASVPWAVLLFWRFWCGGEMVMMGREAEEELDCFLPRVPWLSLLSRVCSNDVEFCVRRLRSVAVGIPDGIRWFDGEDAEEDAEGFCDAGVRSDLHEEQS